ncbi:kinase non-catalytic C-lobe domain-containing protein 1 [Eublepharis macularius]|uniref:Kinase non-catalytic C-lobe domain-containing protein 1 n=1 Tax=Eublepharis macularius TaxID=481883 RepID=A0AA97JLB2_EUBMA|nr:kinase non-catalytic C-lobe domain-containing protein 1 [Eublepharis macularius]
MDGFAEEQALEEDCGDFEPLPTLLEDEENVSLADVLSLQDGCLTEQDIWAICLECSQSMKNIAHSAIFQTLCITPDTLAFNTNGNVCFMEQISDDPEGAFVPPEIDVTGNTSEAHIFSLGATLKAVVEYMMEVEVHSEFSQDLQILLEQMQEENPKERPDIETVISLCKEKLKNSSSSDVCQSLSAFGRRVLSIESCDTFQDSCDDNSQKGKIYECILSYDQCSVKNNYKEENPSPPLEHLKTNDGGNFSGMDSENDRKYDTEEIQINTVNERFCCQRISTQFTECNEGKNNIKLNKCGNPLDTKPHKSDLERDVLTKNGMRKIKTFPKLTSESETDPSIFFPSVTNGGPLMRKHPLKPKLFSVITNNEHTALEGKLNLNDTNNQLGLKSGYFQESNITVEESSCHQQYVPICVGKTADFFTYSCAISESSDNNRKLHGPDKSSIALQTLAWEYCAEISPGTSEPSLLRINRTTTALTANSVNRCESNILNLPEHNCTEMKNCYVEDEQDGGREAEKKSNEQWVFLKHLLTQYGKPLKDYELWALCHECLLTLEGYTDYPAYLCLDSVLINSNGNVLFAPSESEGSYDMFYLAPETAEEDFVTEKVCIYCIAAILWRAAKYNLPPDHKLVLPRKLKDFLLNMARRKSEDRLSLADAIKTCDSSLLEQGINSKKVLAFLNKATFQAFRQVVESLHDNLPIDSQRKPEDDNVGFLPISNESKLIAVKGPFPCLTSSNSVNTRLPTAFTSPATHFKPIVLHQNTDTEKDAIASISVQCKTYMEEEIPTASKNTIILKDDTEKQIDENSGLVTVCMSSDIRAHKEEGSKMSLQTAPKDQYPSKMDTFMDKLPLSSDFSCDSQEKCTSQTCSSSTTPSSTVFVNNFLLKQDPETRVLTLVPVQIAISEQIPNKPLHSKTAYSCCPSLHVLLSDAVGSYSTDKSLKKNPSLNNVRNCKFNNTQSEYAEMKTRITTLSPATTNAQTKCSERNPYLTFCKGFSNDADSNISLVHHTSYASVDQNPASSLSLDTLHQNNGTSEVFLKNVVHFIQEEFALGSYWENTDEALAMGKYIFTLKDLKYNTFCNAVSEKFHDLYWDEKLLASLYYAANGKTPLERINEDEYYCDKKYQHMNWPKNCLNASDERNAIAVFPGFEVDYLSQDNIDCETRSQVIGTETKEECLQTSKCYLSPGLLEESLLEEEIPVKAEENNCTNFPYTSELPDCHLGWRSAFYGSECFSLEVHNYIRKLGKQKASGTQNTHAKRMELEQLIMIEMRNYRKSVKFYQRLLHKERSSKGCEAKTMLPKLRGQLEEMKAKMQFLELVKNYLQIMYIEKWGIEPCDICTVVNMARSETLGISSMDSLLLFYNLNKTQLSDYQTLPRNLQAGTPLGLMAYLYSRNAFLEGYVQQFLFTFRYFCTQDEFLQFLFDRIRLTLPSSNLESSLLSKMYNRSFSILQTWIEDCYTVDFSINPEFMATLQTFIISKVVPFNGYGKSLLSLLQDIPSRKQNKVSQCYILEEREEKQDTKSEPPLCKKISKDVSQKTFNWKFSQGNETVAPPQGNRQHSIVSSLRKPCYTNLTEKFSGFCTKTERDSYFLKEYTAQQLCCQLTLLEQEMFHKCHPVHFLNSRLLGIKDKNILHQKAVASEMLPTQAYNLFAKNCVQDDYLLKLLKYADNVSTWVAAEIVTSYSSKVQMSLLSKFLFIAKCCYEQRNFATAIQILRGLENLIVRQLPAWKFLPSKVLEIMDELKAVEVFLKSDSLCLMEGEKFKTSPTIPSAHVLVMHVQQLETGGFTMRNGFYKWTKLRNIAKVVSQVHAFQENSYTFAPDHQLQTCLRQRMASFNDADISVLAADNYANFHQIPPEKQSQKIWDTLHRMKAMFQ